MFNKFLKEKVIHKPRLGLALSGGGARGLIHIGILKVLKQHEIAVDYIAGTSMGGVIGAGYAVGMSPTEMENIACEVLHIQNILRFIDPALPDGGLIRGQKLLEFFKRHIGEREFADLNIPLALVAVDLNTAQEVVLKEGSIALALRATTAVPGIFTPLEFNRWRLIDGGVLNNLPVDVLKQMGADKVIAVNCRPPHASGTLSWISNHRFVPKGFTTTMRNLDETLSILLTATEKQKLQKFPPDLLIQPQIPSDINLFAGYDRVKELIDIGEKAAEQKLPEIESILKNHWQLYRIRDYHHGHINSMTTISSKQSIQNGQSMYGYKG